MSDIDLLPPNATDQERALATAIARISDVPTPMRDLWNPATCPASLLPWLAWSLHVDEWDSNWTELQKRNVIAASVDLHRHKGTVGSVKRALAPFGLSSALQEWWQTTPKGIPHTFKITLAFITTPIAVQDSIIKAVRAVKPVRSDMAVELVGGFTGSVNAVAVGKPTAFRRFEAVAKLIVNTISKVNAVGVVRPVIFKRLEVQTS